MPCAIKAVPPPTAKPYAAATRKTMVATWWWNSLTGMGSSCADGSTRGGGVVLPAVRRGPQLRVLFFPCLPDASRQPAPDLRPYREQDGGVQVNREVFRTTGLAEDGLIQPRSLVIVVKVEMPIRAAPEQPHRQQIGRASCRGRV